ncbi:hypothetical protein ACH4XT_03240 [Streptomyces avidinii]|uniref:hypothetical protein n=1 Tax=Streptomyces avidinii TaxID=1895 RepID=UPI0037AC106D
MPASNQAEQGDGMTGLPDFSMNSSDVERSDVAEVVTLGKTLTGLFKCLDVTQKSYGYRVHLDHTTISRYLSGTRVPPRAFVNQLISEVEAHKGIPLKESAREAVRIQFLAALKVTSKRGEYELEVAREELELARRETQRAQRAIESLHLLLDSKEEEARNLRVDLARVELDWSRSQSASASANAEIQLSRTESSRHAEELLRQIETLKQDLASAEQQRLEAEDRSSDLQEQVTRLENELAERIGVPRTVTIGSLSDLMADLANEWGKRPLAETERALSEAAWMRPIPEVIEIYNWLNEVSQRVTARFVSDVTRFRSLDEALTFGASIAVPATPKILGALIDGLIYLVDDESATIISRAFTEVRPSRTEASLSDSLFARFGGRLSPVRQTYENYIRTLLAIHPEDRFDTPILTAYRVGASEFDVKAVANRVIPDIRRIAESGWSELAVRSLAEMLHRQVVRDRLNKIFDTLSDDHWQWLMEFCTTVKHDPFAARRMIDDGLEVDSISTLLAEKLATLPTNTHFNRYMKFLKDRGASTKFLSP